MSDEAHPIREVPTGAKNDGNKHDEKQLSMVSGVFRYRLVIYCFAFFI